MSEITYDDKVDLNVETTIADINKVTASDMNEIKSVVNTNADEVGDLTTLTTTDQSSVVNAINELNTNKLETSAVVNEASTETDEVYSSDYLNDKLVSVGETAPTDGERVWFNNTSGEEGIYVDEEAWYSRPIVLWTNSDTTSEFASQQVTLSDAIANYSYYEVLFQISTTITDTSTTGKIPVGRSTRISAFRQYMGYRTITFGTQIATIGNHNQYTSYGSGTTTTTNTICIPYQILGYK